MGGGGGGSGGGAAGSADRPMAKSAITGVAVVLEMGMGGLFMENVKMEKQRTSAPYPQIMGRVLRQGLKGWLAGFWPWGFVLGATKGSVLGGSRAFFLKQLEDAQVPRARADLISGFLAGAVQGVAMSPILLARTRVNQSLTERAAAAAATGGVIRTGFMAEMAHSSTILNQAIKQEGVGLLFKGMPAMVFKRAMDWGTRFIFIKQFTDMATRAKPAGVKLSDPERLALSFCGGAASVAVTMPVDRLMPIIQQASAGNEGVGAYLRRMLKQEGLATLQRGFVMRTLHTGYHTAFAVFVADKLYSMI